MGPKPPEQPLQNVAKLCHHVAPFPQPQRKIKMKVTSLKLMAETPKAIKKKVIKSSKEDKKAKESIVFKNTKYLPWFSTSPKGETYCHCN